MADARWATFDCYGTLVDWNAGIAAELGRLLGESDREGLLSRYHEIEPHVQREHPTWSYRDVMAAVLSQLASETGLSLADSEHDALGRSLPQWPVFAEVPETLTQAHARGWRLMALSNTDRDFIEASIAAIGVPFEGAVVASEIGSYKPGHRHWEAFYELTGADRDGSALEQSNAAVHDRLEHRLHVGGRFADDAQHVGGGGLVRERLLGRVERGRMRRVRLVEEVLDLRGVRRDREER